MIKENNEQIYLAAIDNGLAFPFKHPDQWRSYPYGWAFLPQSTLSFSVEIREKLKAVMTEPLFWERLESELLQVFQVDPDFDHSLWRLQWALIKGQAFNIIRLFKRTIDRSCSPQDLIEMDRIAIFDVKFKF